MDDESGADRFLAVLALTGNMTLSAREAGVARAEMLALQASDPLFAAAMADAAEQAVDLLEAEARRRAVEGIEEPVIRGGDFLRLEDGSIAAIRRYSDRLLEFLLKAHRPEIYGTRAHGPKTEAEPGELAPEERADRVTRLLDAARMRRARPAARG